MCLKYFYVIALLSVMHPFIVGKLLPNFENVIDLKNGEKDSEPSFPINSIPSMKAEDYAVDEQDHGVSHLCVYEHWLKNEIIICDRHQASIFACVGAIEGKIKLCEKSTQNELHVPVCLHEKSSEIITCKYKDIGGRHLCLPRTSTPNNFNDAKRSYNTTSHIAFRVCGKKKRFSCLNNGDIVSCNQPRVNQIKLHLEILEDSFQKSSDDNEVTNTTPISIKKPVYRYKKPNSHNKQHKHVHKHAPFKMRKNKEHKTYTYDRSGKDSYEDLRKPYHKKDRDVYKIYGKNSYRTSRKRKHSKTSATDKNKRKRNHKELNNGNYKKIAKNNYDSGKRDKNTTNNKYQSLRKNNLTIVGQGSYDTGNANIDADIPKANGINKYFHVLKCEDCIIDHVIKVEDEDAYNVKVWTLSSN